MSGIIFAVLVALTNSCGSVTVDTHGARVVSYVPRGGGEVFATFADGSGGMPICAPYFASLGPKGARRHGTARYQDFKIVRTRESADTSSLELVAESDEATRREFPHDYRVSIAYRLSRTLSAAMRIDNTGGAPMPVTAAFHPYFRVGDATRCRVEGVASAPFVVCPGPSRVFPFASARRTYSLVDPVLARTLEFVSSGDCEAAVWTPGPAPSSESLARQTSRFLPDEWRGFVAVENGLLRRESEIRLPPGGFCTITRTIRDTGAVTAAKVDPQMKAELEPLRGNFVSTYDKTEQPLYFWAPEQTKERAVPLLVGLHTWSGDITQLKHYAGPLREAKRRGWAFVGSNFRGPNWTPLGCGSDAAVQDIVDAVAYAKDHAKIDPARVYIVGASGGGHMALLMAGRHPEIFAAAAAFCPPAELARWHREMTTLPRLAKYRYGEHLVKACGGTPDEKMSEYLHRSATTHLKKARAAGVAVYIETGIHDGWVGSVPDGHAIRAFNELADEPDRLTEETIAYIEQNQKIPEALAFTGRNPFYSQKNRVHFRRQSANAVLTIFEGGHGGNWPSAYDFVSRQAKGKPADFTVPENASGKVEALYK